MKKGVNAWCFSDHLNLYEMFIKAKKYGFSGIELVLTDEGDSLFSIDTSRKELLKIKQMAEKNGLELPSIATNLHWKYSLTDRNEFKRRKAILIAEKMLEAAEILGSQTILIVPGLVTPSIPYDEVYNRGIEVIKQLSKIAEKRKVRIGIENVWNKFLLSPIEMMSFVDQIDNPWVGVYFDVGNALQFGFPEQWIKILSKRIFAVHVKDFKTEVGNIYGFVPILSGDVSWKNVREALIQIKYDGYIIPEIPPHKEFPEQLLQETSRSMDKIFKFI